MFPTIGQGTWNIAESGKARQEAKLALRRGIEMGMAHIDTAEMYGRAEEVIAEAIAGLPRERLFIVSKVLPSNASYKGTIKACETSLRRLQTDYLDCYLLHWRGSKPLEETMQALEHLVGEGKIRSLGVSNFDLDDLTEAKQFLKKEPITCNQVVYNLGMRGIERRLLPYCKQEGISVVGYTPFGTLPSPGAHQSKQMEGIAQKYKASIRQIILAFLTRDENVFAIPKSQMVSHTEENAKAGDLELDQEDILVIDTLYPAPTKDTPLAML